MESKPGDLEGLAESSTKALASEASAASAPKPAEGGATVEDEDVPDPDEDDLDDLDGMAQHFSYYAKLDNILTEHRYAR
jgi:peroxin-19